MKNEKIKSYLLPSVLISSALFFVAPTSVDAFDGHGLREGHGPRMEMDGRGEHHEEMSEMNTEEREAFHEERKAEKNARFESKLEELEAAGADTSELRSTKDQVDSAHDEFHDYMTSKRANYDLDTEEGRQAFRDETSEVRSSFKAVKNSFRETMRSVLEKYGLFVGRHK